MAYTEVLPHPTLRPYVDAYWVVTGDEPTSSTFRIYPDSCVDIIFNPGNNFSTDSGRFTMKSEGIYLVGTMTRYKDTVRQPGSFLVGIRFKPFGFTAFFKYHSLHEIRDQTIDFPAKYFPGIHAGDPEIFSKLDNFLCKTLETHNEQLRVLLNDMKTRRGVFSIDSLAKRHFVTTRQLERAFKQHLGITPKEYANFLRYQYATNLIVNNRDRKTLLDIALDAGYYDHAHLSNDMRKYTGKAPSEL
ncbi:MAG TPA: helix-turn-helix domain-containing protein [Cyclobacteriaceae bacterium]|nr:helix-turn-helix domain-containing protein [Cyclobacteriaceae bacterium]